MTVHFVSPFVLLFAPVAIAYLVWGRRTSYVNLSPGKRARLFAVRCALVLGLTLAIAQPTLIGTSRRAPVVLLVDVSDSVPDAALDRARDFVRRVFAARAGQRLEVVTFAGQARRAAVDDKGLPIIDRHDGRHDGGDTDFAQAIAFARGLVPERAPRIVLLTDGNDHRGTALSAAADAARAGVEIDVVDDQSAPPSVDARVTAVRAPDVVRRQEPTRFSVVVESTRGGKATVRLEEASFLVRESSIDLKPGAQTIDVDFEPTMAGLVRYRAQVTLAGDEVPGNDRFEQVVRVAGPPHVLLASATPEEGEQLADALSAQDITVEAISTGSLPSTIEGLLGYDAVVLVGVAPYTLDRLRQAALASFVRDTGGGLLFVSGARGLSRDPDGNAGPIEELLPVELAAPSEKREPPVALLLLIDRSGSMSGEKLGFAKQAALDTIDHLTTHDLLGVIAFDARFDWIIPLHTLDDKDEVKAAVGSLGAGGGTRFYPALEESYFSLASADAAVRHAILLTDGISTDPTADFPPLVDRMRRASITVSTVSIGKGADPYLPELAKLGGGRFYRATRAAEVPDVFVKETETAQRDAVQRAATRALVTTPARELSGIDFASAPSLSGYVRTKAKPTTETLLETERHDPLLVRWRYGLGQVVAFTSDASSAWAGSWLTWPGFGKLWAQLTRGAQRPLARRDLQLDLRLRDGRLALSALAIDPAGRFLDDLDVKARVIDGAGQSHEPPLLPVGPGRYAALLDVPPGSVLARPFGTRGERRFEGEWAVLARPYPVELSAIGPDHATLAALAQAGHGQAIAQPADVLRPPAAPLPRSVPLETPLALAVLALFLLDVITKRTRGEVIP